MLKPAGTCLLRRRPRQRSLGIPLVVVVADPGKRRVATRSAQTREGQSEKPSAAFTVERHLPTAVSPPGRIAGSILNLRRRIDPFVKISLNRILAKALRVWLLQPAYISMLCIADPGHHRRASTASK